MVLWGHFELNLQRVVPQLFHVVPIDDVALLDWSSDLEDATFLLSFRAHVDIIVIKTNHDAWDLRSSNNRREHASWSVIASKTSFANA